MQRYQSLPVSKNGVLSKYLKKLIEQGYIEKVGFGKYRTRKEEGKKKPGSKKYQRIINPSAENSMFQKQCHAMNL